MNDLNQLILKWADDKGILQNGTPEGQLAKTLEELIETAQAVVLFDNQSRHDTSERDFLKEVKDGIGDVYITLVIHAKMNGFTDVGIAQIDQCTNKEIFEELGKCIIDILTHRHSSTYAIANAVLEMLAANHRLTLRECVEHSYNVIARRTGKMQNGVFIKD